MVKGVIPLGPESLSSKIFTKTANVWKWLVKFTYRILPNKGAGHISKVTSDIVERKLRFWAFQHWFRIENWTIIKENVFILDIYDRTAFLQTKGAPLLGRAPLVGRIR